LPWTMGKVPKYEWTLSKYFQSNFTVWCFGWYEFLVLLKNLNYEA